MRTNAAKTSWRYFRAIDDEVQDILFHIGWDINHFKVYSDHLTILLSRIGNEADVLFKQICEQVKKEDASDYTMTQYKEILEPEFKLSKTCIKLRGINHREDVFCKPFLFFEEGYAYDGDGKDPLNWSWWKAYNKTKHERHNYPHLGNFGNVIRGLGAIYWLNLLNLIDYSDSRNIARDNGHVHGFEVNLSELNFNYPHVLFELTGHTIAREAQGYITRLSITLSDTFPSEPTQTIVI
jgi:hypothetical protein